MRARMEKRNESFEQALIANAEAQARDEAAAAVARDASRDAARAAARAATAAAAARAARPRTPPPLSREVSGFSTLSAATTVRPQTPPPEEAIREALKAQRAERDAARKKRQEGRGLGLVKARNRKHKISPEEAMKNRLRLVVSQVQAGNTNPKLMIEVNRLYKKLYKIDNAYSLIKK